MSHITGVFYLSVDPAHLSKFKALINDIIKDARREVGTDIYEYSTNPADETDVYIIERYQAGAVLPHINKTFAPYADRFLELAKIVKLYVYGEKTPDIRMKLDTLGGVPHPTSWYF